MKNLTTQDCKEFLVKYYHKNGIYTDICDWKRVKKYKLDGFSHRDFEHPNIGIVTLKEKEGNLEIISINLNDMYSKPSKASLFTGGCDDWGDSLINNSVKDTLISFLYSEEDEYEFVSCVYNDNSYDVNYDGSSVTGYYYTSGGRDYCLLVYDDNSWIMVSD